MRIAVARTGSAFRSVRYREIFEGRFKVAGCRRGSIGRLVFLPSEIPLESHSACGYQRITGIHFDDEIWNSVAGRRKACTVDQLSRSMNLRSAELSRSLLRIGREILSPGFASFAVIESLVTIVMVDLDRLLEGNEPGGAGQLRGGMPGRKLAAIEERIRASDEPIPTVADLAGLAGCSPGHLLRCYQQETGETLRMRLQQESSARACQLLRSTDLPLKSISWNLGFRSQRQFHQRISPGARRGAFAIPGAFPLD